MIKTALATMIAAVALMSASQADAATYRNAPYANGNMFQGLSLNGWSNGMALNGVKANRLLDAVQVESITLPDGATLSAE